MPPASPKVDVSAPLLRELREAADKSFTGAVDASAGGLTVSVYLEDGLVRAIQSDQFAPPMAQLAQHITGEEVPEGAHPLAFLSDSPNLGPDPDARFDAVESFIVDWSYGLLASALTWADPSITKRKGEKSTGGIYPKDLSLVIQDVTSRVEGIVDSWEIISAELARNGMEPRPASHAAPILAVIVEDDTDLDGSRTVDELAYTTGTSRYTVLSRVSAAILAGRSAVTFAAQHPEVELPAFPVPEALEDATNEWCGLEAIAAGAAGITAPEPEPEPETEPAPEPEPEPGPVSELAALAPYMDPAPGPVPPAALAAGATAPESDPAPVVPTEPVAPVAVADPAPEEDHFAADWVARAGDPRELEIREVVVAETIKTAGRLATEKVESLDEAVASYEQANADLATAQGQVSAAQSELATAQSQAAEAEHTVDVVRTKGQAVLDALAQAQAAEAEAASRAAAAEQAVEAARAALAQAEQSRADAETAARNAGGSVQAAQAEVEQSVGAPLRAAEAELERVRAEVVEPTRTRVEVLQAGVEAVRSTFSAAEERVMDVGADAEKSITVLSSLEAPHPVTATALMGRLHQAHERVSVIRGDHAAVTGAHSGPAVPAPPAIPATPAAPAAVPFPAAVAPAPVAPAAVPFDAAAPVAVPFAAPDVPATGDEDEVALPVPAPGVAATFEEVIAPTGDAAPWDGAPAVAWDPINNPG